MERVREGWRDGEMERHRDGERWRWRGRYGESKSELVGEEDAGRWEKNVGGRKKERWRE